MIPKPPKPLRLPRRKALTIAAGFNFADGVMLCADTEMTVEGLAKYHEQKIFPIDFGGKQSGPTAAFAITGLAGQAKRAIDGIGTHRQRTPAKSCTQHHAADDKHIYVERRAGPARDRRVGAAWTLCG